MSDIRLIAADIDGTLLPRGGVISDATRRAVALCRERGIPFVLATGRWIGDVDGIIEAAGTGDQYRILNNGGAVAGPDGQLLKEWFMRPEDVRRVYAIMRGYDMMVSSFVRHGLFRVNTRAVPPGWLRHYEGPLPYRQVFDDADALEAEALSEVYELEAVSFDPALHARLRAEVEAAGAIVTGAFERSTEVQSPGMGKGTALRWLMDRLGLSPDQCMAFGDNINDLNLLSAVGWPVAMGNAPQAVKDAARIVAPRDVEDGVARVVFEVLGTD